MTNEAVPATSSEWARLSDLISGYQRSQLVLTAARLGLADLLANGPLGVEELASKTGSHAPSLARLLRALAGYGIFGQLPDGRFELNATGRLLRDGVSNSLRPMALVAANDTYRLWAELFNCIRSGKDGFAIAYGITGPEYRDANPEANKNFNAWMAQNMRRRAGSLLQNYAFPSNGVIIDVGGGDGSLVASILGRYPGLRGVVFDLPRVVQGVDPAALGLDGRLSVEAGSFFEHIPAAADVYILSLILHNWPDEAAIEILQRIRRTTRQDAKLIVLDQVLSETPQPSMSDLNMLVNCGALERSEPQWRDLLQAGGFAISRILTTPSLLEAVPV
jgi:hypothetical protein